MVLNLKNLFNGSESEVKIDSKIELPDLIYGTYNPIKDKIHIVGSTHSKADVVYLDFTVSFVFSGFCDRCACEINKEIEFNVSKIVVEDIENEDDDKYLICKNDEVNLDSLVEEEIILYLPSKMLCKEDCKGLCYKCGKNLNHEKCDCKPDVDPRMEALLQLLDN